MNKQQLRGVCMSEKQFRLQHSCCAIIGKVKTVYLSTGKALSCNIHDVINETPEQIEGSRQKQKTFDSWEKYHESHGGKIQNMGGGTMEFYCTKCWSTW